MAHSEAFRKQRRKLLLAGVAVGGLGVAGFLKPEAQTTGHSRYFLTLQKALREKGLATPTLVIDRQRLNHNIAVIKRCMGEDFSYRIVAKSLPSVPLLQHVMAATGTRKLMLFHQPSLNQVTRALPDSDILLGKPLPVACAGRFYRQFETAPSGFKPDRQLQWLVDSPARLAEYRQLAEQRQQPMRVNLEIDIGLHRGGFASQDALVWALTIIERSPWLTFSGFMGYEPHILKAPGPTNWLRDQAMVRYQQFVDTAERTLGRSISDLTLNTGGSTTYQLYQGMAGQIPANELAAGSALVMPTDFDVSTLADHQRAAFIATPVLKLLDRTRIPGAPGLGRLQTLWNPNHARTAFIYGGYWKASPVSPPGLVNNSIYGRSTNQEMLNFAEGVPLKVGDRVFLRPHQSESVLLQFGDLAVFDGAKGEITERWPVFGRG
ncbi:DSD1 family PLP-dependent enzyme [Marinobacter sp. S0848L]|uniref:DSD1 family PLP-dependent enzyme n=1 Tax=Marinobacter sp. S0848L TaxID=2926423 RepID=UPI001FF351A4|nr:DSD1 family PLP-dependent enzyme [Marinobacter sp. S0848L]MCK0106674.1 DSD1 family PLP-dependent enzyme [Marinobacter sp. S0848L]